jgi:hypothetical protein
VLARVLYTPVGARRTGVIVVLIGAFIHTLWTNMLQPVVAIMPYGGPPPGLMGALALNLELSLLVVAVPVLFGWASPTSRVIGALLAVIVGVLGIVAVPGAFGGLGVYGAAYTAVQVARGLVVLAAVFLAVVAARRLAESRQAANPAVVQPQAEAQPSAEA